MGNPRPTGTPVPAPFLGYPRRAPPPPPPLPPAAVKPSIIPMDQGRAVEALGPWDEPSVTRPKALHPNTPPEIRADGPVVDLLGRKHNRAWAIGFAIILAGFLLWFIIALMMRY